MGGRGANYVDQETTVTKFLNDEYPFSISATDDNLTVKGHVCGFKANQNQYRMFENASSGHEGIVVAIVFVMLSLYSG